MTNKKDPNLIAIVARSLTAKDNIDTYENESISAANIGPLQDALTKLGYDTKGVDGNIGNNTAAAIMSFLNDNKGKYADTISKGIENVLQNYLRADHKNFHEKLLDYERLKRMAGAGNATLQGLLEVEDKLLPVEVERLQKLLIPYGYPANKIGPSFGPLTAGALVNFIKANPQSLGDAYMPLSRNHPAGTPHISYTLLEKLTEYPQYAQTLKGIAEKSPDFKEHLHQNLITSGTRYIPGDNEPLTHSNGAQVLLKIGGYYKGTIDGILDKETSDAIKNFLKQNPHPFWKGVKVGSLSPDDGYDPVTDKDPNSLRIASFVVAHDGLPSVGVSGETGPGPVPGLKDPTQKA